MDRPRVAIVIPAWNEAATIADVVRGAREYGLPIMVDDGSNDQTAALAREAGAEVVVHEKNRGYEGALNSGFRRAAELECEIIVTADADGQHDPTLVAKFVDAIDAGADVVIGIRSRRQRVGEHLFALYTRARFGIEDPLCGMKAYRRSVYDALGHFDSRRLVGTELALFAAKRRYRIGQTAFQVRERQGASRFGQVFKGNYRILRALLLTMV